jgi:hypothetical protein
MNVIMTTKEAIAWQHWSIQVHDPPSRHLIDFFRARCSAYGQQAFQALNSQLAPTR